MQTNTLSAFNPSQKTKRTGLINLVTTRAMRKLPKANPQATPQHQIHKQKRTDKAYVQSRRDIEIASSSKNAYTMRNAYAQKIQCMSRTLTPNPQIKHSCKTAAQSRRRR